MEVIFKIIDGANWGQSFKFNEDIIKIGRSKKNHIQIEDKTVSGFHSTITFKDGKFEIADHSKNGTFVNGKKIKEAILNSGDEIRVGQTTLQFVLEGSIDEKEIVLEKLDETQRHRISIDSLKEEKTRVKKRDELPKIENVTKSKKRIHPIIIVIPAVLILLGIIYLFLPLPSDTKKPVIQEKKENETPTKELVDINETYKKLEMTNFSNNIKNKIIYGKEKYDGKKRQPGNLYEAIKSWKEALPMLNENRKKVLEDMIYTAEEELKAILEGLQADAKILSKGGDKKGAALKLQEIKLVVPDPENQYYKWANYQLVERGFQKYLGE